MGAACVVMGRLKAGSLDFGSEVWAGVFITAGVAAMLAVPATLGGWLCVRQLPVRLVNAATVALLGGLLGLATLLALHIAWLPQHGWNPADLRLTLAACVCGVCGASAAWWAGFRREVRDR